jgi:hypothetical protein
MPPLRVRLCDVPGLVWGPIWDFHIFPIAAPGLLIPLPSRATALLSGARK